MVKPLLVRRVGNMVLPAERPRNLAECEAYLRRRRAELGIPEVDADERRRRQWLQRLDAFVIEGLPAN